MSAETLRKATKAIREEWGSDPVEARVFPKATAYNLAVSDLLDVVLAWVDEYGSMPSSGEMEIVARRAVYIARAYLGETA